MDPVLTTDTFCFDGFGKLLLLQITPVFGEGDGRLLRNDSILLPLRTSARRSVKYVRCHSLVQKAHDLQVSFFINQSTQGSKMINSCLKK